MSQIARTIFEQLGGSRFVAMTGARCSYDCGALIVKLPRSAVMTVELMPSDTYQVKFGKLASMHAVFDGKPAVQWRSVHDDVYAEDLRELFERETGLCTSL